MGDDIYRCKDKTVFKGLFEIIPTLITTADTPVQSLIPTLRTHEATASLSRNETIRAPNGKVYTIRQVDPDGRGEVLYEMERCGTCT